MRVLSIRRPWAALILAGLKPVENRVWSTRHRGEVWLHAAKGWDGPTCYRFMRGQGLDTAAISWDQHRHPVGILGLTHLLHVCSLAAETAHPCDCGPWAMPGQHHFRLASVRTLPEPVPCRGRLGLWNPGPEIAAQALRQLAQVTS